MRFPATILFSLLLAASSHVDAAYFVPDDFQDGTVQGWVHGGISPNPPVNVADGGPLGVGDGYLLVTTSGAAGGAGSKLLAFNGSTWQGDYAGHSRLNFDVNNLSVAENLHVRVALAGPGGAFASTDSLLLATGSDWQNATFSLKPSDFTGVNGGSFGVGTDIDATLGDVVQLRIISSAAISFFGDAIPGIMGLDNIVTFAACDFDGSQSCDLVDINLLLAEGPISAGVAVVPGANDQFDLNGDAFIDNADVDQWLADAADFDGLSSPYKRGDADLSGSVNGQDFILWNASKFTSSLNWDNGDFNGDGAVNGQDFILWNANKFTSSDSTVIPEPTTSAILWLASLVLLGHWRRKLS